MKNICVIGTGYVGLVTGACFAELGNRVRCVDIDEAKVASLREGVLPIYEPGLDLVVQQNMEAGRLMVTASYGEGMEDADFVFVTVGTPNTPEGDVDLRSFRRAYEMAATNLNGKRPIFVNKSTVPPGTSDMMGFILARLHNGLGPPPIVANPEFLREGHAVSDFMNPARVVIGARDPESAQAVAELHRPLGCPILVTDPRSAEMIKYASNAFLAMKISFINEIAEICGRVGVDVTGVAQGMGMDARIGKDFLNAGIGYGGSCLPKDMAVLTRLASERGYEAHLLNAAVRVNRQQPLGLVRRVKEALGTLRGAKVAVLGLTFKPNTDDTRHSSAIEIIKQLQAEGAEVKACDPQACLKVHDLPAGVEYVMDPFQAAQGCAAVILATEWPQYTSLDLKRLRAVMDGHILADGRNAIDPGEATRAGLVYIGVGRASQVPVTLEQAVADPVLLD